MYPRRHSTGHWMALCRDIAEGVRSQPGRCGLTLASLTIGMAALVMLLAIVGGIRQRTQSMVGELGIDVFGIVQPPTAPGTVPPDRLSRRHAEYLSVQCTNGLVTGWQVHEGGPLGLSPGAVLATTDENLFLIRPWSIAAGRPLDAADVRSGARCAVASSSLARALRLRVGDLVRIRNVPFRLVGIAEIETGALEAGGVHHAVAPGDRLLLVPWSAPACWSSEESPATDALDAIFIKVSDPSRVEDLIRRTGQLLAQPDYAVATLSWVTPSTLIHQLRRFQRLVLLAGGGIVVLCLVLGGITLTSLLLASLQARIPEIGLRRALGASPTDVGLLFMCEALFTNLTASAAGVAGAWMTIRGAIAWTPLPLHLGPEGVIIPVLCGMALGIVFSYWPARAAARISPSEALRND